jgi:hypothetical protein
MKFTRQIESGMLVDTTMPDSIIREAFCKCNSDNDLRVVTLLSATSTSLGVTAGRPPFNEISTHRKATIGFRCVKDVVE